MSIEIKLTQAQLAEAGARYRANYLVEQAGYTLGLAAAEGAALAAILPKGFLADAQKVLDDVYAGMKDKAMMAAEAKDATRSQNRALQYAKVWRRKVASRAMGAKRLGYALPEGLTKVTQVKTVPAMASQMAAMVKLLEANAKLLPGADIPNLATEGKTLLNTLKEADASQELKRLKSLPDTVKKFYAAKGTLYICLKVINDTGKSLHADKLESANRYNLSILHRHAGKKADKPQLTANK